MSSEIPTERLPNIARQFVWTCSRSLAIFGSDCNKLYSMMNRRLVLGGAAAALAQVLLAQTKTQTAAAPPLVFEHDLPDVNMHNWEVRATEIHYEPGGTSTAHRHPGITIVYVLEGEIESQVEGGSIQTYRAGQMFMETPNQLHRVSRNASRTKPARFLAILLTEKGVPLVTPA